MGRRAVLAWAGIIGPVLFTATYMAQEVVRRGEYSPMAEPISALEVGPYGWVQQLNFVVFGVLTIGYALGLHIGVEHARFGAAGPGLLVLSGIGLVLAAVFPLRQDPAGETFDPGGHAVSGAMFFSCSALGLILLSRRLKHDDAWRPFAGYTLVAGLIALAGFVTMFAVVLPPGAPLEDWTGLAQRLLILLVLFPCRIALDVRLLRLASGPRLHRAAAGS
ncbi:DUF998 domain-containing protein [Kocuria sp. M4R2S49]|uniref:DUF998 domain-containing protein n=1 Tax=Kocuria rhizosphaericola TaxID=3376284 RepID=UPI0037A792EE